MKQKTKQAAAKRFTVSHPKRKSSARHRVIKYHAPGQAHFNSRKNGKKQREHHESRNVDSTDMGRIERLVPYAA